MRFHTERMPCDGGGRDWDNAPSSQGMPKRADYCQKLGRVKEGSPYKFQSEHDPLDTLILDFEPPEL